MARTHCVAWPVLAKTNRPSAPFSNRRRESHRAKLDDWWKRRPAAPLFLFVKEDENLYPNLDYSPARQRTARALDAIRRVQDRRGGKGIWFAPHVTGSPHEILDTVHAVLDEGATAVMFSETYSTGTVRMVREATKQRERPPAIYGHNAGIGTRERCIWREVIDLLARMDGIDFRQTAPVSPAAPFIRPYGAAWEASERVLTVTAAGRLEYDHDRPGRRPRPGQHHHEPAGRRAARLDGGDPACSPDRPSTRFAIRRARPIRNTAPPPCSRHLDIHQPR